MDYIPILEEQAKQRGLSFTPLSHIQRLSQSDKVACCGGSVVRVVTESSSDSTVAIQDGPNSMCYCAIHGDVTSRYPDVLTAGALLLFTNVTALILSSAVAPLLIVCTDNVAGLALPQETHPPAGYTSSRPSVLTESAPVEPLQGPIEGAFRAAPVHSAPAPQTTNPTKSARAPLEEAGHVHDTDVSVPSSEDEDGLELADEL